MSSSLPLLEDWLQALLDTPGLTAITDRDEALRFLLEDSLRGLDFALRIGINTGPVVVGRIGDDLRMDYTAQGETVNLAARLQAAAPPGGVLISEATRRLVSDYFLTDDRGEFDLKGLDRPVRAWAVVAQRSRRARFEVALERGLTPLVGRSGELAFLREFTRFENLFVEN